MKPHNRLKASDFLPPGIPKDRRNFHLRDRKSFRFVVESEHPLPETYQRFFVAKVLPLLPLPGYKQTEKQQLAERMVYSLIVAHKRAACVADSRDMSAAGVRMRAAVWDAIVAADLAIKALGSAESGMVTRYAATDKLLLLRTRWRLEDLVPLDLERNSQRGNSPTSFALVYAHVGKINPATGDPLLHDRKLGIPLAGPEWEHIEDIVEAFNDNVLNFAWKVKLKDPQTGKSRTSPVNPCLRQLHCRGIFKAVRFYSWSWLSGQLLSKDERKHILISGQPVAELDYSGCQLRMLYHLQGLNPQGDVYRPERVFRKTYQSASAADRVLLRELVKRATLICLNVQSRGAAHSSLGRWVTEHEQRQLLWQLIRAEQPKTRVKGIIRRIVEAHTHKADAWKEWDRTKFVLHYGIAHKFFTGEGLRLMTEESKMMRLMLQLFTRAHKPALMIHDAVVCRVSDVLFTKRVMTWAWRYMLTTSFHPVIRREF